MTEQATEKSDGDYLESKSTDDIDSYYQGSEPVFGMFSQTKVVLNGIRMTIKDKVVQQVGDLASNLETIRREFLHDGDCVKALQAVDRVRNQFAQRAQQWEGEAQRLESNRLRQSGEALKRMRAEHSRVRNTIFGMDRLFSKLSTDLNQICSEEALKNERRDSIPNDQEVQEAATVNELEIGRPDHHVAESLAAKFGSELQLLLGQGVDLKFSDAEKIRKGSNERELTFDGRAAVLVAGWHETDDGNLNVNEYSLQVWIIPKHPNAVWGAERFLSQHDLIVEARESDDNLRFDAVNLSSLTTEDQAQVEELQKQNFPKLHRIQNFLRRVFEKRFARQDSSEPTAFRVFHAQSQFANEGSFDCRLRLEIGQ